MMLDNDQILPVNESYYFPKTTLGAFGFALMTEAASQIQRVQEATQSWESLPTESKWIGGVIFTALFCGLSYLVLRSAHRIIEGNQLHSDKAEGEIQVLEPGKREDGSFDPTKGKPLAPRRKVSKTEAAQIVHDRITNSYRFGGGDGPLGEDDNSSE